MNLASNPNGTFWNPPNQKANFEECLATATQWTFFCGSLKTDSDGRFKNKKGGKRARSSHGQMEMYGRFVLKFERIKVLKRAYPLISNEIS